MKCIHYGDCPFNTYDCEETNGHFKCKYRETKMKQYDLHDGRPVYSDERVGAILLDDEQWHPFRYFDDGDLDIGDEGFIKPTSAYKIALLTYT